MCDKLSPGIPVNQEYGQIGGKGYSSALLVKGARVSTRERLEKRLSHLQSECDKIIEVLKHLTPEVENNLIVNELLNEIGHIR